MCQGGDPCSELRAARCQPWSTAASSSLRIDPQTLFSSRTPHSPPPSSLRICQRKKKSHQAVVALFWSFDQSLSPLSPKVDDASLTRFACSRGQTSCKVRQLLYADAHSPACSSWPSCLPVSHFWMPLSRGLELYPLRRFVLTVSTMKQHTTADALLLNAVFPASSGSCCLHAADRIGWFRIDSTI